MPCRRWWRLHAQLTWPEKPARDQWSWNPVAVDPEPIGVTNWRPLVQVPRMATSAVLIRRVPSGSRLPSSRR